MNAIEQRGRGGDQHDGEGEPVSGVKADGEEDDFHAEVGRVADDGVEAGGAQLLIVADGDVSAEGATEVEDGDPADDESENENQKRCRAEVKDCLDGATEE